MSFAILYPLSSILSAAKAPPSIFDYLPEDPFDFFRWWLGWIVTIYATVITLQSLWGWYVWLAGSDKYMTLLRRYVLVQGLRLRFRSFWGDVIKSDQGLGQTASNARIRAYAPVAQRTEHQTSDLRVGGSSPSGRARLPI